MILSPFQRNLRKDPLSGWKPAQGFTLLELILSLTILSVVIVLIFGAFRIGGRAWEKGERGLEHQQRMRVVFDLIKRQIRSACVTKAITSDDGATFYMRGDSASLEFFSETPIFPGDIGVVYLQFRVFPNEAGEGERLSLFKKEAVFFDEEKNFPESEKDFHILIPAAREIRFEYLAAMEREEEPQWIEQWEGTKENGFPRAVRVSVTQGEDAPLRVIARIEQAREGPASP
jgi:general secretion pathway protein J